MGKNEVTTWKGLGRAIGVAMVVGTVLLMTGCAGIRLNRSLRERPFDWLTLGGAPNRVNHSISHAVPPLMEMWEYNSLGGIRGTPLVRDSVVLVVTLNGEMQAVNLTTGERIGYVVLESAVVGTPVWDSQYVYVATAHGTETLSCYGLRDAEKRWVAQFGPIESSPLALGELLFVTTLDGVLYCINKADGDSLWKYETAEQGERKPIRSSPASDGALIVFGADDGCIYAVERTSGTLRWRYQTGASIFASPIVVQDLCVVGSLDGCAYAIQMGTGKLAWKFDSRSRIFGPAAASDSMTFIGTADGHLYALRTGTGERVWTFSARSIINSAPLIVGDVLYVGSMDRTLYALQKQSGEKMWQYDAPGRIRVSPVLWGDILLMTSEDRFVTALRPNQK